jgi:hypothetical protein
MRRGFRLISVSVFAFFTCAQGSAFDRVMDLSTGAQDFTVYGNLPTGCLGFSAASGDVNGDGINDLILGGPGEGLGGSVYVILGRRNLSGAIDLAYESADLVIEGYGSAYDAGSAVGCGDINGDGYDDILVSCPGGDGPDHDRPSAGEVVIIFGKPLLPASVDLGRGQQDAVIYGKAGNLAKRIFCGDLNADGTKDLILTAVSAPGPSDDRPYAGAAYVFFGTAEWPPAIDLAQENADITFYGPRDHFDLGDSVVVLDMNLDSLPDIFLGAELGWYSDSHGRKVPGIGYIFFGRQWWPSEIDLAYTTADVEITGGDGWDRFGTSCTVGDINGDGNADLVVGADGADGPNNTRELCGEAYCFFASNSLPAVIDLAVDDPDLTIYGKEEYDETAHGPGVGLASDDVNDDGVDDIMLVTDSSSNLFEGRVDVIFGKVGLAGEIDLAQIEPDVTIYGADQGDNLGWSIATGDFNGDKGVDLLLGADHASGPSNDRFGCGEAYLLYGEPKIFPCSTFEDLRVKIREGVAHAGIRQSLLVKADQAEAKYGAGQIKASGDILCALIHEIEAQRRKEITEEAADGLILCIQELAQSLGIPIKCLEDEDSDESADEDSDEAACRAFAPRLFCKKLSSGEVELRWSPEDCPLMFFVSSNRLSESGDLLEADRSPYYYLFADDREVVYFHVWK